MSMFSLAITLFLLMDSIGNIPIFLSILKGVKTNRIRWVIFRELSLALIAIIIFYFVGELLLTFLGISQQAVLISGGIILFIIAIKLIFSNHKNGFDSDNKEPFLVPLAIPLICGPATIATVMLYSHQEIGHFVVLGAIFIAWAASTLILLSAASLKKILGEKGLSACEKLTGLLLIMLSVQMFLDGLQPLFNK